MPQKCDNPMEYNVEIEEFDFVKNRMGNCTLLEKSFNQVCQNASYKSKCEIYPKSCFYLTSSLEF